MLDPDQPAATEDGDERSTDRTLERVGADPLDPLLDGRVPRPGEAVRPIRVEQLIGASAALPDGSGGARDAPAAGQGENEKLLPFGCPAVAPSALARNRIESDMVGGVGSFSLELRPIPGCRAHRPVYALFQRV